jgi:hypothetical protein
VQEIVKTAHGRGAEAGHWARAVGIEHWCHLVNDNILDSVLRDRNELRRTLWSLTGLLP